MLNNIYSSTYSVFSTIYIMLAALLFSSFYICNCAFYSILLTHLLKKGRGTPTGTTSQQRAVPIISYRRASSIHEYNEVSYVCSSTLPPPILTVLHGVIVSFVLLICSSFLCPLFTLTQLNILFTSSPSSFILHIRF